MKVKNKIILSFDLDFTLINNREGIINSFNYALEKYKLPKVSEDWIEKTIGTPLDTTFAQITEFDSSKLISAFREFYGSTGIFQAQLFAGVKEKLNEFKSIFCLYHIWNLSIARGKTINDLVSDLDDAYNRLKKLIDGIRIEYIEGKNNTLAKLY